MVLWNRTRHYLQLLLFMCSQIIFAWKDIKENVSKLQEKFVEHFRALAKTGVFYIKKIAICHIRSITKHDVVVNNEEVFRSNLKWCDQTFLQFFLWIAISVIIDCFVLGISGNPISHLPSLLYNHRKSHLPSLLYNHWKSQLDISNIFLEYSRTT